LLCFVLLVVSITKPNISSDAQHFYDDLVNRGK
jgi:hypothetical protein